MVKVKKVKRGLAAFISSEKGQRFFNFAYSIGAAIVIWGALFKILHLPGGNALLSIGMGTEVLMFVLTAFDRPPREYKWEKVYPVLDHKNEKGEKDEKDNVEEGAEDATSGETAQGVAYAGGPQVIISGNIGGGAVVPEGFVPVSGGEAPARREPVVLTGNPATDIASVTDATQDYMNQLSQITEEMQHLKEATNALNNVSDTLLESYRAITQHSAEIGDSANGYVEQMKSLNRNIQGLNTIYEIQLKSVSSQLDAIDRVNRGIKDIRDMYEKSAEQSTRYCEETEKMARYMQQLNTVYEKMITAMTINMYRNQAPQMPDAAQPQD